ncbi:MAG: helix-turn-helix domain-containing protein [Bifidobacteriaceae bacterium]|jgi:transcriptional regulator with XRE-family HTH domain|nr:helix-turn-helix domain-containing protein [Bifidobacteriaceae bacterium]
MKRDNDQDRSPLWKARRERLGRRIRSLRLERGLSQEALGLECGLSRNMLIGVEWGKRGLMYERLEDIADALGVTIQDLITAEDPASTE